MIGDAQQISGDDKFLANMLGPLARYLRHTVFTKVQRASMQPLFERDDNVLVAAPTGSGKTLLLEVAMLRLFRDRLLHPSSSCADAADAVKAVYVCPIKALAAEKYAAWSTMFAPLTVAIETGDQEKTTGDDQNLQSVTGADIIVTTPERWDSITRRWKERTVLGLVSSVGLLLLDEIHTVSEERGAVLEALVSRTKAIKSAGTYANSSDHSGVLPSMHRKGSHVRLIAISGTLPNIHDVGEWLDVRPDMRLSFSDTDRPVPLTTRVLGFSSDSRNAFVFDRFLTFKLFGLLRQYGEGKPAIIFCASRKETVTSAQQIVTEIEQTASRSGQAQKLEPSAELKERVQAVNDKHLKACLLVGIAFHHAALSLHDRQTVEQLFREQFISAVCTTTTLALGVNLPAHLVVVKGTTFFKNGSRDDLPLSEVAQMCGRAGRPGLDPHGVALILTTENKVAKYDQLRRGDAFTTIESRLHQHMIEHVNAEVALRTIHSFESAVSWVKTTFFWIRLRRNPTQYGLTFDTKAAADRFDAAAFVSALVRHVLEALQAEGCVAGVPPGECSVHPELDPMSRLETTGIGRAMSRLYILFETVKTFNAFVRGHTRVSPGPEKAQEACSDVPYSTEEVLANVEAVGTDDPPHDACEARSEPSVADTDDNPAAEKTAARQRQTTLPTRGVPLFSLEQTLTLLARSHEFLDVRLRQGDRGHLNDLNKNIKYPLKSGKRGGREVREDWHKAFVLIQAPLSQLPLNDMSLRNDSMRLWSAVPRVVRFLCEYSWFRLSYSLAFHADVLRRSIERKVWPDGLLLRQLQPAVSETVVRALANAGMRHFSSIDDADPRRLEMLCSRLPPFGNQLKSLVAALPRPSLSTQRCSEVPTGERGRTTTCESVRYRLSVDLRAYVPPGPAPDERAAHLPTGTAVRGGGKRSRAAAADNHVARPLLLLVGHVDSDAILLKRYVPLPSAPDGAQAELATFELTLPPAAPADRVTVHIIVADLVGHDVVAPLEAPYQPAALPSKKDTAQVTKKVKPLQDLVPASTTAPAQRPPASRCEATRKRTRLASQATVKSLKTTDNDDSHAPPAARDGAKTDCDHEAAGAVAQEAREAYEALLVDLQYVADSTPAKRSRVGHDQSAARSSTPQHPSSMTPAVSPLDAEHSPEPAAARTASPASATCTGDAAQAPRRSWVCAALPPPPRLQLPVAHSGGRLASLPSATSALQRPSELLTRSPGRPIAPRFRFGVSCAGTAPAAPQPCAYDGSRPHEAFSARASVFPPAPPPQSYQAITSPFCSATPVAPMFGVYAAPAAGNHGAPPWQSAPPVNVYPSPGAYCSGSTPFAADTTGTSRRQYPAGLLNGVPQDVHRMRPPLPSYHPVPVETAVSWQPQAQPPQQWSRHPVYASPPASDGAWCSAFSQGPTRHEYLPHVPRRSGERNAQFVPQYANVSDGRRFNPSRHAAIPKSWW